MPESQTLLRVFQRGLECTLRNARRLRRNSDSSAVERGKCDFVAFAFVTDAIRRGHFAVREDKFAASSGADAEFLFFLPTLKPGVPFSTTSAVIPFSPFAVLCSRKQSLHLRCRHW